MSHDDEAVVPLWRALAQWLVPVVGLYALARARGYSDESALLASIAGVVFGAGGWLAYYTRTPLFSRRLRPGPPRDGVLRTVIAVVALSAMAIGVGILLWVVLAIGRE